MYYTALCEICNGHLKDGRRHSIHTYMFKKQKTTQKNGLSKKRKKKKDIPRPKLQMRMIISQTGRV
jgi:hypothetical protein